MSHYLSPGDYLPHDASLEEVVSVAGRNRHPPRRDGQQTSVLAPSTLMATCPAGLALELMAQTIGVWSGWHRQQQGQASI